MIEDSRPISNTKITFDGIQILRGLAASMVVFSHFSTAVATFYPNTQLLSKPFFRQWGSGGVDIFFVISGFIMYYTTIGKQWSFNAAKLFLLKRITRIYPLYWIFTTLLAILIIGGFGLKGSPVTFPYAISSYLLVPFPKPGHSSSFHPILDQGWTLSFEMYFYLVFSMAIFARQKGRLILFLLLSFFALAGLGVLIHNVYPPIAELITSPLIIEFVLGIVIAKFLLSLKEAFHRSSFTDRYINIIIIISGVLFFLMTSFYTENHILRVLIWGPAAAIMVFSGALLPKFESKVAKSLIYLGNASFSIYLTHSFFSIALGTLLKKGHLHQFSPDLIIIVFSVSTIILCSFVYLLIEKPVVQLMKNKLSVSSENK